MTLKNGRQHRAAHLPRDRPQEEPVRGRPFLGRVPRKDALKSSREIAANRVNRTW